MKVGSLFSGVGGFDLAFERVGMETVWQVEIDGNCNDVLGSHWPEVRRYHDITGIDGRELEAADLICGGFHVKISQWPADVRALLESGRGFGSSSIAFLRSIARLGLSLRTSPACYPRTEGGTLPSSFEGWSNSGMALPGGYWTLSTSESPSGAVASSLSAILETFVPRKYYLSPKACAGILRRAAKRGKESPERLKAALMEAASQEPMGP